MRQRRTVLKTTSFYLPLYPTPRSLSDREWGGLGWWRWELEQVKGTAMGTASCCDVKSECWSSSWVPTHVVRALQGEALGLVRRNRTGRAAEVGAVGCSRVSRRVRVLQPKRHRWTPVSKRPGKFESDWGCLSNRWLDSRASMYFAQNFLVWGDLRVRGQITLLSAGIADADIRTQHPWDCCSLHVAKGLLVSRVCNFRLVVKL